MEYAKFPADEVTKDKFFSGNYSHDSELNKLRLSNYKKIVAFQKYTSSLSDDSLKALFTIIKFYLKNELFNKEPSPDLIKVSLFFTYDKFKTDAWWSELYTLFLDNHALCDIFSFIDFV
jgi:hypothetical protein